MIEISPCIAIRALVLTDDSPCPLCKIDSPHIPLIATFIELCFRPCPFNPHCLYHRLTVLVRQQRYFLWVVRHSVASVYLTMISPFSSIIPLSHSTRRGMASDRPDMVDKFIRMTRGWQGQLLPVQSRTGEMYFESNNVYRDGILVPHVEIRASSLSRPSPISHLTSLVVNIPKTKSKEISLARNQIVTDSHEWAGPIFAAHTKALARKYCIPNQKLWQPSRYLFRLASFMVFHGLSIEQLSEVFPQEDWPFPLLQANGRVVLKRYGEIIQHPINRAPNPLSRLNTHLMRSLVAHC